MKQLFALKATTVAAAEWSAEAIPLVVFPRRRQGEKAERAASLRACAERYLPRFGSMLFRGFQIYRDQDFARFVQTFGTPSDALPAGSIWGEGGSGRMWIACASPVDAGAETLIADNCELLANLSSALRTRLAQRGLRFVIEFPALSPNGWQQAFRTSARSQVEAMCRAHGDRCEWSADDALRIERRGRGLSDIGVLLQHVARPRTTGDAGFAVRAQYANGSALEASVLAGIAAAFAESASPVAWEPGDVLLVDRALSTLRIPAGQRRHLRFASERITALSRVS